MKEIEEFEAEMKKIEKLNIEAIKYKSFNLLNDFNFEKGNAKDEIKEIKMKLEKLKIPKEIINTIRI